jgi:coenzyme PQQ precursor peptide PqqA
VPFGRFREQFGLISCAEFTKVSLAGVRPVTLEEHIMSWNKPKVVEVSLALEINSYASAEIG